MSLAFLLGAGFSFELGFPLASRLVGRAATLIHPRMGRLAQPHQRQAMKDILKWSRTCGTKDIEKLLELADAHDRALPNRWPLKPVLVGVQLRNAVRVLFDLDNIRCTGRPSRFRALDSYLAFLDLVDRSGPDDDPASLVTVNYDTGVETVIAAAKMGRGTILQRLSHSLEIDYGLGFPNLRVVNPLPLLYPVRVIRYHKVHGSTNWNWCRHHGIQEILNPWRTSSKDVCEECPEGTGALLVYPEKGKISDGHLTQVWNAASRALGAAETIVAIGVSFSPTDRQLFDLVAGLLKSGGKRLVVLDPFADRISRLFETEANVKGVIAINSGFGPVFSGRNLKVAEEFAASIGYEIRLSSAFREERPHPPLFGFEVRL